MSRHIFRFLTPLLLCLLCTACNSDKFLDIDPPSTSGITVPEIGWAKASYPTEGLTGVTILTDVTTEGTATDSDMQPIYRLPANTEHYLDTAHLEKIARLMLEGDGLAVAADFDGNGKMTITDFTLGAHELHTVTFIFEYEHTDMTLRFIINAKE